MKQSIWILFTLIMLALSGCSDSEQQLGQPCTAEKFCEPGQPSVCGEDGATYACGALALCEGVTVDGSGEACDEPQTCSTITCDLNCPNGYKTAEDSCDEICECIEDPAETCGDDPCVPFNCGGTRGQCIRESQLITMGACAPGPFQAPETQCECTDEQCGARECETDADCGDGLCVSTPNEDRSGYCINSTCDDLRELYANTRPEQVSCVEDNDCRHAATLPDCCGAYYVNEQGLAALRELDEFIAQTSCGREWADRCAVVDCAPPEGEPVCVDEICQSSID